MFGVPSDVGTFVQVENKSTWRGCADLSWNLRRDATIIGFALAKRRLLIGRTARKSFVT